MMDLSLAEIGKACKGTLVLQGTDGTCKVDSVVLDSRKATSQGVFVATVGERVDGHRFIGEVFAGGVSLVITEKTPKQVEEEHGVPVSAWKSYLLVRDSFQALKELAEYYRQKLSLPIVGITGSVGKTSTKEFIAGVLAEKYKVLKTEGNFNNEVGVPLTLLRIRPEHEVAVVEMGISDFGEMHRLSRIVRPNVCVITNIGQCHLENLKTRDGILKAKTEIFDFMDPEGWVCLNGEDDKLAAVTRVNGKKTHFFGLGANPLEEVYATDIVSKGLWGSEATLHIRQSLAATQAGAEGEGGSEKTLQIQVPLPGIHMVTNSAAAACVAGILGLTQEQIKEGISKVAAVSGRNHLIRLSRYTLIDDCYNANPVSMKAALDLLAMADTRRVAILGDMFELGENSPAMHAEVGSYAVQKGTDYILCVGEASRFMAEGASRAVDACSEHSPVIFYFADRQSLLEELKKNRERLVPDQSTVLIKASHGMVFTEVLEYLKEAGE